jgi:hypothetical protein
MAGSTLETGLFFVGKTAVDFAQATSPASECEQLPATTRFRRE